MNNIRWYGWDGGINIQVNCHLLGKFFVESNLCYAILWIVLNRALVHVRLG